MSEAHKQQLQRIAERYRKQRLDDVAALLGLPEGRRFFGWLMDVCGANKQSYTGNSETYFNEGKRNVWLRLLSFLVEVDEDAEFKIVKEYRKEKAEHDRAIADAGRRGAE